MGRKVKRAFASLLSYFKGLFPDSLALCPCRRGTRISVWAEKSAVLAGRVVEGRGGQGLRGLLPGQRPHPCGKSLPSFSGPNSPGAGKAQNIQAGPGTWAKRPSVSCVCQNIKKEKEKEKLLGEIIMKLINNSEVISPEIKADFPGLPIPQEGGLQSRSRGVADRRLEGKVAFAFALSALTGSPPPPPLLYERSLQVLSPLRHPG